MWPVRTGDELALGLRREEPVRGAGRKLLEGRLGRREHRVGLRPGQGLGEPGGLHGIGESLVLGRAAQRLEDAGLRLLVLAEAAGPAPFDPGSRALPPSPWPQAAASRAAAANSAFFIGGDSFR
jgi:hypothetical protein